jgi:hypothetical protein
MTLHNNTNTLTYTNNNFSINAYSSATSIRLINDSNYVGPSTSIALTDKTSSLNISGIFLNIPIYIALYNNSSILVDYADIVTITQTIPVTDISVDKTNFFITFNVKLIPFFLFNKGIFHILNVS